MLCEAIRLAREGWPVFALNGKTPYQKCPTCTGAGCKCDPNVHLLCHGFHGATLDEGKLTAMWRAYPRSNIGLRPPPGMFVVDADPRHPGYDPESLPRLTLPSTRKMWSGREDGGYHLYFRGARPKGKLAPGVDIRDWGGYVVVPPSLHPDTMKPYRWEDAAAPIAEWPMRIQGVRHNSPRAGDEWMGRLESVPGSWHQVLEPEGWTTNGRGDWRHPAATSTLSARVLDDLLYVWSTSTVFEATEPGSPRGYNRIEAYALLNDISLETFEGWTTVLGALA